MKREPFDEPLIWTWPTPVTPSFPTTALLFINRMGSMDVDHSRDYESDYDV